MLCGPVFRVPKAPELVPAAVKPYAFVDRFNEVGTDELVCISRLLIGANDFQMSALYARHGPDARTVGIHHFHTVADPAEQLPAAFLLVLDHVGLLAGQLALLPRVPTAVGPALPTECMGE